MILELVPMLFGLLTDNKEVADVVAKNPVAATAIASVATAGASAVVVDILMRIFPQKSHKSVLTLIIAFTEFILPSLKKYDEKLSVKKKDGE